MCECFEATLSKLPRTSHLRMCLSTPGLMESWLVSIVHLCYERTNVCVAGILNAFLLPAHKPTRCFNAARIRPLGAPMDRCTAWSVSRDRACSTFVRKHARCSQGERHFKLSRHASAAMPTHNDTYLTCATRVSALKAGKRHMLCGRNVLFLLLPLEDGRAAGLRGRRFTSKAG